MKYWSFKLICAVWLAFGGFGSAACAETVIVGFYNFAPLIWMNQQGQAQGPLYRFSEKILAQAGLQGEYRELPSARLYSALKSGSVHLWPGASRPEISAYTLDGQRVLGQLALNLYYLKGLPQPQLPHALAGKRLIRLNGYSYWPSVLQSLLAPQLKVQTVNTSTHSAALSLLARGRGDYLLNYQAPTELHARYQRLQLDYVPVEQLSMRFVVSKAAPNAWALRQALDDAYDKMLYSGEQMNLEAQ